jgi:hypothetical protein
MASHPKLDDLLDALARTDGEARQQLAEANAEILRSDPVFQRAGQRAAYAAEIVKRLEAALAVVRASQEGPAS